MSLPWELDDGLRHNISRARVVKVDDKKSQQMFELKGRKYQEPQKVWRPQDFGYTSVPPKDSDGFLYAMGGRSDRYIYQDGGHEKYRPKNTPDGCSALFNMHGDIIRVFKDNADVVHSKKVNIRVGKVYEAGSSGGQEGKSGPDDEQSKDTKNISMVMDGNSIVIGFDNKAKVTWDGSKLMMEFQNSKTTLEAGKTTVEATKVVIKSDDVNLGGEGGDYLRLCGGACSTKVKAL